MKNLLHVCIVFTISCFLIAAEEDDHGHNHGKEKKVNTEKWEQISVWNLKADNHSLSLCKEKDGLKSMKLALLKIETNTSEETIKSQGGLYFSTFSSHKVSRIEIDPDEGIILPNGFLPKNKGFLYQISLVEHDSHDSHDSHEEHKDDSREESIKRKNCEQVVIKVVISTSGKYALYTEHSLKELNGKIYGSKNVEVASSACIDGCGATDASLSTTEKWGYTVLCCLIVSLTSIVGVFALACIENFHDYIDYLSSLSAGTLIAMVLFHLYPEANGFLSSVDESWSLPTCVMSGILLGVLIELIFHLLLKKQGVVHTHNQGVDEIDIQVDTRHSEGNITGSSEDASRLKPVTKYEVHLTPLNKLRNSAQHFDLESNIGEEEYATFSFEQVKSIVWVVALGDFFHGFTDGILIAISFQSCNKSVGWLVTLAVCIHETPHRLSDFFIFLKAGLRKIHALILIFLASLSGVLGAVILLSFGKISNKVLGYLIGCGSGTLLFIGMTELLPSFIHVSDVKRGLLCVLLFIAGIIVIGITTMYDVHCDASTGGSH